MPSFGMAMTQPHWAGTGTVYLAQEAAALPSLFQAIPSAAAGRRQPGLVPARGMDWDIPGGMYSAFSLSPTAQPPEQKQQDTQNCCLC